MRGPSPWNKQILKQKVRNLKWFLRKQPKTIWLNWKMNFVVLGKLPPGKFLPGWFPPDNSHPENPHQRKFPPRITTTWTIPTRKIPTQDNSHLENSHPGKLSPRKLLPRITPTWKIPTQKIPIQIIAIQKIPSNIVPTQTTFNPINSCSSFLPWDHSHALFPIWGQGKSSLKHTNVKRSRLFYATNILHEQFSNIVKCLMITPLLNKQQGDSEISENPVS